jgi:hypothetical protein
MVKLIEALTFGQGFVGLVLGVICQDGNSY